MEGKTVMIWVIMILGGSIFSNGLRPYFQGPYESRETCERVVEKMDKMYDSTRQQLCITGDEARRLGWKP